MLRKVGFHNLILHLFVIKAVFGGNIEAFVTGFHDSDWATFLHHLLFAAHSLIGCTLKGGKMVKLNFFSNVKKCSYFAIHVGFASIHMDHFFHFVAIGFRRRSSDGIDIFAGLRRR